MYLDDKDDFCPICESALDLDGTCPNGCDEDMDVDLLDENAPRYADDLEDVIPGTDYLEQDDEDWC
jgi:hypothetical protein